jgi:hypothetical protein
MIRLNPSARARIERAFRVSFKLPGQAAELLDAHEAEVRNRAFAEAIEILRAMPIPTGAGDHWHWFDFARNRGVDLLIAARTKEG